MISITDSRGVLVISSVWNSGVKTDLDINVLHIKNKMKTNYSPYQKKSIQIII